jgi:5-methylcytosine-specific restriction endonuclease McrA
MAITPEYQAYLNSPKWKNKRLKVLMRAKFKCEQCKKAQATQVHHLTYKRLGKGDNIGSEPLSDLLAVCARCHRKIHGIKDKPKKRQKIWGLGEVLMRVIK